MAVLSHIRLELGRTPEFPEGSSRHGYEFVAPLNEYGHVDPDAYRRLKQHCGVERFWGDEPPQFGMLHHRGHGWRFEYGEPRVADEPIFKLDRHVFAPGNYVSIGEDDGALQPFRIVDVSPLPTAAAQQR